jgi:hypothetical protein
MELAVDQHGHRVQALRFGTTIHVAYTSTAGTTAAVGRRTSLVMIRASTTCFLAYGTNPTATTSDTPIVADVNYFVLCNPGDKFSAIQESSGGTLYVTELK